MSREGYKMTEVGEIPEDWDIEELGNTATYFNDGDWIELPYITNSGIRLIQTGNIGIGKFKNNKDKEKYITKDSFQSLNCNPVYPGDVLICRLADPIGRCCILPNIDDVLITAVDVTIYRVNAERIDKIFITQYLNEDSTLTYMAKEAGGSTRQRISRKNLQKIKVPLPPLPEQQKIASILSTLDATIEHTETLIDKYRDIKKGLMADLLTRGIDENGRIRSEETHRFKDSPLGRVPDEWGVDCLKHLIEKIIDFRGKTPKKIGMEWGGGNIPALSANNVGMGNINLDKEKYLGSEELYSKWMNKGDAEKGDIVLTMEAPLGNVAQIPDERKYILSQRVVLLKLNNKLIDNDYLKQQMINDIFQNQLKTNSTGTTATGIQQAKLVKLFVYIPPIPEQQKIASILSSADERIEKEEAYRDKLLQLKKAMMQDLLTGQVRVKV